MLATHWNLTVATAPAFEPVSLQDARLHLRADTTVEDPLIASLVAAVRTHQEHTLGVAMATQTLALRMDCFPGVIELPRSPAVSVTSIAYVDGDGESQTLASSLYVVDVRSHPARIVPAYGESWPVTRDQPNAVTVTYIAGYAEGLCPYPLQAALKLRLADLYEHREASIIGATRTHNPTADALEAPWKVWWF